MLEQLVQGVGHVHGQHAPRPPHLRAHDGAEGRRLQVEHGRTTTRYRADGDPGCSDAEGPRVRLDERGHEARVHLAREHRSTEIVRGVDDEDRGGAVGDGGEGFGLRAVGHVETGPAGVRHLVRRLAGEAGLSDAAPAADQPGRHRFGAAAPVEEGGQLGGPADERHGASGRCEQPPGRHGVGDRRTGL
ncbi:hypothetical protein [Promicromonospora soli]